MDVKDNAQYIAVCSECETAFLQSSVIVRTVKVSGGAISYCNCPNCGVTAVLDNVPTITFIKYVDSEPCDRDDPAMQLHTDFIKQLGDFNGL